MNIWIVCFSLLWTWLIRPALSPLLHVQPMYKKMYGGVIGVYSIAWYNKVQMCMVGRGAAFNPLSEAPVLTSSTTAASYTKTTLLQKLCCLWHFLNMLFSFLVKIHLGFRTTVIYPLLRFFKKLLFTAHVMDSTSDPDLLSPFLWAMKCVFFLTVVSHISLVGLRSIGCPQETRGAAEEPTVPSCGGQAVVASLNMAASIMTVWRASWNPI